MQTADLETIRSTDGAIYGGRLYKAYVLFVMFLVYFMTAIDRTILIVLVEPIKADLGLTDSQVGVIAGPAFAVCFTLYLLGARSVRADLAHADA